MRNYIGGILCVLSFFLIGCSSTQPIKKVSESSSEFDSALFSGETSQLSTDDTGAEKYRVFSQGATAFVPQSAVRANAEVRATKFCTDQGMLPKLLEERRSPQLLIFGGFPRSELIFVCVSPPQRIERTKNEQPSNAFPGKYERLKELKKLKDEGLITTEEYEFQKARVLAN